MKEAAAAEAEVIKRQSYGSSPRLVHAAELERFARRAADQSRPDAAIAYYQRAISLRQSVRVEDPKNSDCACVIAQDFTALSEIEKKRDSVDASLKHLHQAYQIYADLSQLELEVGWTSALATTALSLAELYDHQGEPPPCQ